MKKIISLCTLLVPSLMNALDPAVANIIGNNTGDGILIVNNSNGNVIAGNAIGTNLVGSANFGNGGAGVRIEYGSSDNTVGGLTLAEGNLIANNHKGVVVGADATDLAINNAILNNSIYNNTLPGIDLANDGPTQNHAVNPVDGPNNFQNYPVLGAFTITNTGLSIPWTLHTVPNADYILQFFTNAIGDPEGRLRVAQVSVTTDANGNASGTIQIGGVPLNTPITATATQLLGLTGPVGETSEFSAPLVYGVANPCLPKPCK